jgi:hypothetical protein
MEEIIKNELLKTLSESDIEENQEFLSILLDSEHIPQEEREVYINKILTKFLGNITVPQQVLKNVINARNNLNINYAKNKVKKI